MQTSQPSQLQLSSMSGTQHDPMYSPSTPGMDADEDLDVDTRDLDALPDERTERDEIGNEDELLYAATSLTTGGRGNGEEDAATVELAQGKEDANDGNWYCNGCWQSYQ